MYTFTIGDEKRQQKRNRGALPRPPQGIGYPVVLVFFASFLAFFTDSLIFLRCPSDRCLPNIGLFSPFIPSLSFLRVSADVSLPFIVSLCFLLRSNSFIGSAQIPRVIFTRSPKTIGCVSRIFPVYFPPVAMNRYAPFGTAISNRAPLPGTPFSVMVMPVIARISRERNSPSPVFFPKPRVKSFFLSS